MVPRGLQASVWSLRGRVSKLSSTMETPRRCTAACPHHRAFADAHSPPRRLSLWQATPRPALWHVGTARAWEPGDVGPHLASAPHQRHDPRQSLPVPGFGGCSQQRPPWSTHLGKGRPTSVSGGAGSEGRTRLPGTEEGQGRPGTGSPGGSSTSLSRDQSASAIAGACAPLLETEGGRAFGELSWSQIHLLAATLGPLIDSPTC